MSLRFFDHRHIWIIALAVFASCYPIGSKQVLKPTTLKVEERREFEVRRELKITSDLLPTGMLIRALVIDVTYEITTSVAVIGESLEAGPTREEKRGWYERAVKSLPITGADVTLASPTGTTQATTNAQGIATLELSNEETSRAQVIQISLAEGIRENLDVPEEIRADAFEAWQRNLATQTAKQDREEEIENHNHALRLFYEGESLLEQRKRGRAADLFAQSVKVFRKIDDLDSQNLADLVEEKLAALRTMIRASDIDNYDQAKRIYSWRPADNPMENILATSPAEIKGEVVHVDGEVLQNFYNQRFLIWDYRIQRAFMVYTPDASEWVTGQSVGIIGRVRGIETYRTADGTSNTVGVIDVLAWKTCAFYAGRCYP